MHKRLGEFFTRIKYLIGYKLGWINPELPQDAMHSFSRKKTKTYITRNETLLINGNTKLKIADINKDAKDIFKRLFEDPEKLLEYIESQGTPVIKAKHIEKVLFLLGETEGFILPMTGAKARFLTLMINILSRKKVQAGSTSPAMFIMRDMPVNIYYLAHHFYHWLSYTNGLPGYDESADINLKSIFSQDFGSEDINRMSIDEILSLKEAIARDLEAIKFVKEMARELIGAKDSANRLKNGESLNL